MQLSGVSNFAEVQSRLQQSGSNTVLTLDGDSSLTFANVSLGSLAADDFRFV